MTASSATIARLASVPVLAMPWAASESVTCEGRDLPGGASLRQMQGNPLPEPKGFAVCQQRLAGHEHGRRQSQHDWYAAYRLGFALAPRIKYLDLISTGSAEHGQGGRPGSVCGAVGCIQACNAHLEAKKVLRGGVKG